MYEKKRVKKDFPLKSMKFGQFNKLLKANEGLLKVSLGENQNSKNMIALLRELQILFKPYAKMNANEVLEVLNKSFSEKNGKKVPKPKLTEKNICQIPFEELKSFVSLESWSKNELLIIANKRMGMPIGTLKKMKKEIVRNKILNEIENTIKFETIKNTAAQ